MNRRSGTDDVSRSELLREDGRDIEVLSSGSRGAMPLIFHVGTPMALAEFEPLAEAAAARELRTVIYSRPGYGRSSRKPGQTVADTATDVRAILRSLDADHFVTLGWSGGGPRALACAALFGDGCRAAIAVGGVAPYRAPGLDWLAGMTAGNVAEYSAALGGEAALEAHLQRVASGVARLQPDHVRGWLAGDATPQDAPLAGPFVDFVAKSFRRSQTQGIWGWLDDDLALIREWGFDIGAIRRPVALWHGTRDAAVPPAHGRWLAEHIPGARGHFPEGHGHFSLPVVMLEAVLDELLDLAR